MRLRLYRTRFINTGVLLICLAGMLASVVVITTKTDQHITYKK